MSESFSLNLSNTKVSYAYLDQIEYEAWPSSSSSSSPIVTSPVVMVGGKWKKQYQKEEHTRAQIVAY